MGDMVTARDCCLKTIRFWSVCEETPCPCTSVNAVVEEDQVLPIYWSGIPCDSRMEVAARVDDVTDGTIYTARIWNDADGLKEYTYTVDNEGGAGPDQNVWQVAEALAALINANSGDFDTPIVATGYRDGFVKLNAGEVPIRADFLKTTVGEGAAAMTDQAWRWPTPVVSGPCVILGSAGSYDEETSGGVSRVSNFAGFGCWDNIASLPPCLDNEFRSAIAGKAVLVVDSKVYVWRAKVSTLARGTNYAILRTTQIGVFPPAHDDVICITTEEDEAGTHNDLAQKIADAISAAWGGDGFVASAPGGGWVEIHHETGHRRFGNDNSTFKIVNDGYTDDMDTWSEDSVTRYGLDMTGWDLIPVAGQQNARLMDENLGEEVFEHTLITGTDEEMAWAYAEAFNTWVVDTPEFKGFRGVKACRVYDGPVYGGEVETYSPSPTALYLGDTASDQNGFYNNCRVVVIDAATDTFDITVTKFQSAAVSGFVGGVALTGGAFSGSVTVTYHYSVGTCDESDELSIVQTHTFGDSSSTVLTFNKFNPEDVDAPEGAFVALTSVEIAVVSEVGEGEATVTRGDTGSQETGLVNVTQGVTLTSDVFPDFDVNNDVSEPVTMDVGVDTEDVDIAADETGPVSVHSVSEVDVTSTVQIGTITDYTVVGPTRLATIDSPGWSTPPAAGSKLRIYRRVRVQFSSGNPAHPDALDGDQPDKWQHNGAHDVIFWARNGNLMSCDDQATTEPPCKNQMTNAWSNIGVVRKCCGPLHGSTYAVRFAGEVYSATENDFVEYDVTASITVDNENTTGDCKGDGPDDTPAAIADKWVTAFNAVAGDIPVEARPTATHTGSGVIVLEGPVYYAENPPPLPPDTTQEYETAGPFNFHADQPDSAWLGFSVIQNPVNGAEETDTVWYWDGKLAEIPYRPFVGWSYQGSTTEWHAANIAEATIVGAEYADGLDCTDEPPQPSVCPGRCGNDCLSLDTTVTISGSVTWREQVEADPCTVEVIHTTSFNTGPLPLFSGCTSLSVGHTAGPNLGYPDCATGTNVSVSGTVCPTGGSFQVSYKEIAGGGAPPCNTHLVDPPGELFANFYYDDETGEWLPGNLNGTVWEPYPNLCDGQPIIIGTATVTFSGGSEWHLGTDEDCESTFERCLPGPAPEEEGGGMPEPAGAAPAPAMVTSTPPARKTTPGVAGTVLTAMIRKLGYKAVPGCGCKAHAKTMNAEGTDWCERNIDTIVGWLREEAATQNKTFIETAARLLVKRAIAVARKREAHRLQTRKEA